MLLNALIARLISERRRRENGSSESSKSIQGLRLREPTERTNTHKLEELQLTTNESRTIASSFAAELTDGV